MSARTPCRTAAHDMAAVLCLLQAWQAIRRVDHHHLDIDRMGCRAPDARRRTATSGVLPSAGENLVGACWRSLVPPLPGEKILLMLAKTASLAAIS
jgi:hypothetical protein